MIIWRSCAWAKCAASVKGSVFNASSYFHKQKPNQLNDNCLSACMDTMYHQPYVQRQLTWHDSLHSISRLRVYRKPQYNCLSIRLTVIDWVENYIKLMGSHGLVMSGGGLTACTCGSLTGGGFWEAGWWPNGLRLVYPQACSGMNVLHSWRAD